jgi:hypothetical protein
MASSTRRPPKPGEKVRQGKIGFQIADDAVKRPVPEPVPNGQVVPAQGANPQVIIVGYQRMDRPHAAFIICIASGEDLQMIAIQVLLDVVPNGRPTVVSAHLIG